jgi:hypothetical protein
MIKHHYRYTSLIIAIIPPAIVELQWREEQQATAIA